MRYGDDEFIYVEQRGKDMYLVRECSSCTIESCVDYEIEQGRAVDISRQECVVCSSEWIADEGCSDKTCPNYKREIAGE